MSTSKSRSSSLAFQVNGSNLRIVKNENLLVRVGNQFGRWTVLGVEFMPRSNNGNRNRLVVAQCKCGEVRCVGSRDLLDGSTNSCGCFSRERTSGIRRTHGQSTNRLYRIFAGMKRRCYNTTYPKFDDYGGRGIAICVEWLGNFQAFFDWAMANGYSSGLSIDRIDNSGNYEPSNCRWVASTTQANNTRRNRYITHNNQTLTLADWCRTPECKVSPNVVWKRLDKGWPFWTALTTPIAQ